MRLCLLLVMLVALSACGATAVIPEGTATAETAADSAGSQLGSLLPDDTMPDEVWPVLAMLQGTAESAVWLPLSAQLDVENIDQNPELPNGCEITSAAIVLNYLGFSVDKVTLAEEYLPMHVPYWEADPNLEFMGDPADELAFYCLPGAVVTAVNDYLDDMGADYVALDISGAPVEELYQWVASGAPGSGLDHPGVQPVAVQLHLPAGQWQLALQQFPLPGPDRLRRRDLLFGRPHVGSGIGGPTAVCRAICRAGQVCGGDRGIGIKKQREDAAVFPLFFCYYAHQKVNPHGCADDLPPT